LIGIAGSTRRTYEKYDYAQAMRTQLDVGIFAYCGITDVESHLIYDVEGDHNAPLREKGLQQASEIARAFLSAQRVVRNAEEDHLRDRL
jgi:NAD(P)H dehydrogenase (quinone)